jgi:hypothetical protein
MHADPTANRGIAGFARSASPALARQLRRRLDESRRCAPIDDRGTRDPWARRADEITLTPGKWDRAA